MEGFSIEEAMTVLRSLGFLVIAMVVYSVLVFHFYRFLARRDIVTFNVDRYKDAGDRLITGILSFLQTVILSPIVLLVWFAALAAIMSLLGRNQTTDTVLLISVALISTVRVAAYYNEDLSKDIAKMLPFALLGIYLVDQSYFDIKVSLALFEDIPNQLHSLVYYLAFVFALEVLLRIACIIAKVPRRKRQDIGTTTRQTISNS
jgi:hypothetical protein